MSPIPVKEMVKKELASASKYEDLEQLREVHWRNLYKLLFPGTIETDGISTCLRFSRISDLRRAWRLIGYRSTETEGRDSR